MEGRGTACVIECGTQRRAGGDGAVGEGEGGVCGGGRDVAEDEVGVAEDEARAGFPSRRVGDEGGDGRVLPVDG